MIVGRGLILGVAGTVIGVAVSLALSRIISSQLHRIEPTGTGLVAAAVAFLLIVVLAASYVPARRAMFVEPSTALRYV